jgi:hypothetical protein
MKILNATLLRCARVVARSDPARLKRQPHSMRAPAALASSASQRIRSGVSVARKW